jgi:pyruvate,water dikinase
MAEETFILNFSEIGLKDIPRVGGKNASLGQLYGALRPLGVGVTDGFAITTAAYQLLLDTGGLRARLRDILTGLDPEDVEKLKAQAQAARTAVMETTLPEQLQRAITEAYVNLCHRLGAEQELAVRSSATAEDLPEASFAGQQETFLNVRGRDALLSAVQACFASLFTDRAITYRAGLAYDHLAVALSVGV